MKISLPKLEGAKSTSVHKMLAALTNLDSLLSMLSFK